jgi:hypothetical protein
MTPVTSVLLARAFDAPSVAASLSMPSRSIVAGSSSAELTGHLTEFGQGRCTLGPHSGRLEVVDTLRHRIHDHVATLEQAGESDHERREQFGVVEQRDQRCRDRRIVEPFGDGIDRLMRVLRGLRIDVGHVAPCLADDPDLARN